MRLRHLLLLDFHKSYRNISGKSRMEQLLKQKKNKEINLLKFWKCKYDELHYS